MTRYCPKCGEPVPSNCLTCPKCYAKVPLEPETSGEGTATQQPRQKSDKIKLLLTIVPGLFGLLGLGIIYEDPSDRMGFRFLIGGLLLFCTGAALVVIPGILTTVLAIGPFIVYFLLFLLSAAYTLLNIRAIFRHLRSEQT